MNIFLAANLAANFTLVKLRYFKFMYGSKLWFAKAVQPKENDNNEIKRNKLT